MSPLMSEAELHVHSPALRMTIPFVLAAASLLHTPGYALVQDMDGYSTNAICRENFCINPVFPGFTNLEQLESIAWQCYSRSDVKRYMKFCTPAVWYDVAIPSPNTTMTLEALVYAQDKMAATMYFYHLNGMNIEPWRHQDPANSPDECLRSVWQMVCNTYFPRVEAGCSPGEQTRYLRPCKSVCENYVSACGVKCCDESTQCVFQKKVLLQGGKTLLRTGYVDDVGPAATCTGSATSDAKRSFGSPLSLLLGLLVLLQLNVACTATDAHMHSEYVLPITRNLKSTWMVALLSATAFSLQGCDAMGHAAATWESKPGYMVDFKFVSPGQPISASVLNTCEVAGLPPKLTCNGNGVCRQFRSNSTISPLYFCLCDRDWADPECRTRRKSQFTAFFMSLFFGYLGVDRFYLGMYYSGIAKMMTAGGAGVWWLVDLVRIGSSPIYATDYRLAADLPHAAYVFITVVFFTLMGAAIFWIWGLQMKKIQRKNKKMLQAEDDFFKMHSATVDINPSDEFGMPRRYPVQFPVGIDMTHQSDRRMAQPWGSSYGAVQQQPSIAAYSAQQQGVCQVPIPIPQPGAPAAPIESCRGSYGLQTSAQAPIPSPPCSAVSLRSQPCPVPSTQFPIQPTLMTSVASGMTVPALFPAAGPEESRLLSAAPDLAEQPI